MSWIVAIIVLIVALKLGPPVGVILAGLWAAIQVAMLLRKE